jgi:hypothetical protein
MNAKELRIGNYLKKDGVMVTIDARSIFDIWDVDERYKPIPLTEDWLLKFGFSENYHGIYSTWGFQDFDRYFEINQEPCLFEYFASPKWIKLEFVHQLQNLYFALEGEELKFKDNADKEI